RRNEQRDHSRRASGRRFPSPAKRGEGAEPRSGEAGEGLRSAKAPIETSPPPPPSPRPPRERGSTANAAPPASPTLHIPWESIGLRAREGWVGSSVVSPAARRGTPTTRCR